MDDFLLDVKYVKTSLSIEVVFDNYSITKIRTLTILLLGVTLSEIVELTNGRMNWEVRSRVLLEYSFIDILTLQDVLTS